MAKTKKARKEKKKNTVVKLVEEVVTELVSEEAIPIVLYLRGKHNVSEFKIAEDLDIEIHRARNLMYRLLDHNILYFYRKKDKIKGWYICYWNFNEKVLPYLKNRIEKSKKDKLRERLERESSNSFYMCKNACVRMDFEKAMDFNFKCPECGELMEEQDNSRTVEFLRQRIDEMNHNVANGRT